MASPWSQDSRAGPIRYGPSDPIAARVQAERQRRILILLGTGAALVLGALFLVMRAAVDRAPAPARRPALARPAPSAVPSEQPQPLPQPAPQPASTRSAPSPGPSAAASRPRSPAPPPRAASASEDDPAGGLELPAAPSFEELEAQVREEEARRKAAQALAKERAREEAARTAAERRKKPGLGPDVRDMDVGELEKYLRDGKKP